MRQDGLSGEVRFRAIVIGDRAVVVATSGEMYQDYGPILTRYSSAFMPSCGLANGYSGYIPTTRGFNHPFSSYELDSTPFTNAAQTYIEAGFKECCGVSKRPDVPASPR